MRNLVAILCFWLLAVMAGCGGDLSEPSPREAVFSKDRLEERLAKMSADLDAQKAEEEKLWADWTTAYPVIEEQIREGYPFARDCKFDRSSFQVKEQPNRQLEVTGVWLGKDDAEKPARVTWKATVFLMAGRWQIFRIQLLDKKPL